MTALQMMTPTPTPRRSEPSQERRRTGNNWALRGFNLLLVALATLWVAMLEVALILIRDMLVPVLETAQSGGDALIRLREE